ncbi:hypothetical protein BH20ACT4_BH20ACT4_09380 [soil metagenome]
MERVRWGLSISLGGELAEPAAVAEVAVTAEEHGWDGIFVWDHLWHAGGEPFADPFVTLAAVAAATSLVRIGPLVTPLARRRPATVAQQVTTLDRLSDGRVIFAVGLGSDHYGEYTDSGEEPGDGGADDPDVVRARARRVDAAREWILPALGGDPVTAAGGRRTTHPSRQHPRPPIWVAGLPGRLAGPRRAARHGLEGVALVGGGSWQPEIVAAASRSIDETCGPGLDVALVGGEHAEPAVLAASGATWLIPELRPGSTVDDACELARIDRT